MDQNKKEKLARFGIATKGVVYCLIGGLTAMAAFGQGGKKTGSSGTLEFVASNSFGQILLGLIALGLVGFVYWRLYQAIADPEGKGNDGKGIVRRIGYAASGIFYIFLIVTAVQMLTGSGGGSGGSGGNGQEQLVGKLLQNEFGQILVGILAVIFLGKAIYQFYRAFSNKFKEKVQGSGMDERARKSFMISGKIGYISRGAVVAIISFLTFKAAFTANSSQAGGTKDAFNLIQHEFGTIVLGVIAIGLVAYGIFMFVKARHRQMLLT